MPVNPGQVNMYVCGITPYDDTHLGHARCYTVFDVIRRYLEYKKYKVRFIQNFTDIDDKIINRSREKSIPVKELSQAYISRFFDVSSKLNIKPADKYPLVTEYIPQIIKFISGLIEKGSAYKTQSGDICFSVEKFNGYGKLSNRKIDELVAGTRVEIDENKSNPLDFALWKLSKPGESWWDSPWGNGRPGWHIECSTMSMNELQAETIDIHGGGLDLIFPHHENEIAQSESLTGKPFSKYWIHNGFVTVNKEKMSKSLGNFFTLSEIFKKYEPMTVRYLLLTQHYRTPIDFSDDKLAQAKAAYSSIIDTVELAEFIIRKQNIPESAGYIDEYVTRFEYEMNNDFNTENAVAVIFELKNRLFEQIKKNELSGLNEYKNTFKLLLQDILGLKFPESIYNNKNQIYEGLLGKVEQRDIARKNKDWQKADEIRKELELNGYLVEDTSFGPCLKRK